MAEIMKDNISRPQHPEEGMAGSDTRTQVAVLGPAGSFSHQAVQADFPEDHGFVYSFCPNIESIFVEVQEGSAFYGLIPFENSTEGPVPATLDLLADRGRWNNVSIMGESFVGVHHALLGYKSDQPYDNNSTGTATPTQEAPVPRKPITRPLTDLSHVKTLHTHPMAWGQCKSFLSTFLPGRERVDSSSTSKAAQRAAEDRSGFSASISCIAAAKVYGLDILASNIEDKRENTTRFLVLEGAQRGPPHAPTPVFLQTHCAGSSWRAPHPAWKSLVRFMVDHNRLGALAEAMQAFSQHQINMTSINTRPSQISSWHYIFFVEFLGRIEDENVAMAVEKLEESTQAFRFLGTFRDRSDSYQSRMNG